MKLGKKAHEHDDRTLMLANFFKAEMHVPAHYDFDKGKAGFPVHMWGNDEWGDCVIAGEANQLLRLERIEQRRTIGLRDEDAINRYKSLTGAKTAGDSHDSGLVVLDAMRNWFHKGWHVKTPGTSVTRNYKIAAYGELEPNDPANLRAACYALHGVHFGFSLPLAARSMTDSGVWDYTGATGSEWEPGSWGGHLVYSKAYTPSAMEILTWGRKVTVTNAFISRYVDEAWAVVDSLDSWSAGNAINVGALVAQLHQISHKVNP